MLVNKVLSLSSSASTSPYILMFAISLVSTPSTTSTILKGFIWNPSSSEFKATRHVIGFACKFAVTTFLSPDVEVDVVEDKIGSDWNKSFLTISSPLSDCALYRKTSSLEL